MFFGTFVSSNCKSFCLTLGLENASSLCGNFGIHRTFSCGICMAVPFNEQTCSSRCEFHVVHGIFVHKQTVGIFPGIVLCRHRPHHDLLTVSN
jgi:hypothetical protein